jgi:hypothetical protein
MIGLIAEEKIRGDQYNRQHSRPANTGFDSNLQSNSKNVLFMSNR